MNITRRRALIGASAVVATAGLPVTANAATLDNADAGLFALIDEFESVYREHEEIAAAEFSKRQEIEASLPMPPESIQFGRKRLGRDHVRRRTILVPSLIELMRAARIQEQPDRSEQIGAHFDRVLDELHTYKSEIDRLRNSPKVRALGARLDEIQLRFGELAAEIRATPAHTVAGVLRKVEAAYPSGMGPAMIESVIHDLDRLAGEG